MIYTTLGRFVAGFAFALGLLGILVGFSLASSTPAEPGAVAYLGTKSSGQWIDRGIFMLVFGVVVGVLTDISRSLTHLQKDSRPNSGGS